MANAYRIAIGDWVSYMTAGGKWVATKVTAVTSQTSLTLAYENADGSATAIGSGILKRTAHGQTNVWRCY